MSITSRWDSPEWLAYADQFLSHWVGPQRNGIELNRIRQVESDRGFTFPQTLVQWWELAGNEHDLWFLKRFPRSVIVGILGMFFYDHHPGISYYILKADIGSRNPPICAATGDQVEDCLSEFLRKMLLINSVFAKATYYEVYLQEREEQLAFVHDLNISMTNARLNSPMDRMSIHAFVSDDLLVDMVDGHAYFALHSSADASRLMDLVPANIYAKLEHIGERPKEYY